MPTPSAAALLASFALLAAAPAAKALDLDQGGQRLVDRVNREVNRSFAPLAPFDDPNGDGVWDCENYAAEKMARLAAAGVPAEEMALKRVRTTRGEWHAVLVVKAVRRGRPVDLVLDNLSAWTAPREALPYTGWQAMAGAAGAGQAATAATPKPRP